MWDRLRSTCSPASIAALAQSYGVNHPSGARKQHHVAQKSAQVVRPDEALWANFDEDEIVQPVDALGISNLDTRGPNRYAVQRGKIVPQQQYFDVVLPSQSLDGSVSTDMSPTRRSSTTWRPTSSISSQSDAEESPITSQYKLASSCKLSGPAALQISPPSSPDLGAASDGLVTRDVSPIDDDLDSSQCPALEESRREAQNLPSQQRKVSITRPIQAENQTQIASIRPRHLGVRSTGQRACSQKVQTGQDPVYSDDGVVMHLPRVEIERETSSATAPTAKQRKKSSSSSIGQRMQLVSRRKLSTTDSCTSWNGASGQAAIVQPMRDDHNVALLAVARKCSKRVGHVWKSEAALREAETPSTNTSGSAMRRLLHVSSKNKLREDIPVQPDREQQSWATRKTYPSPPYHESMPKEVASFDADLYDQHKKTLWSHPPNSICSSPNVIKRKPAPVSLSMSSASKYSIPETNLLGRAESRESPLTHLHSGSESEAGWVPPPSRFSITTYATSDPGTPRHSSEDSLPPLPALPPVPGVMARSRPVVVGRRKSSFSAHPVVIDMSSPYISAQDSQHSPMERRNEAPRTRSVSDFISASRRESTLSMSKPLPRAPPELTSDDPVSQLESQISSLFHRRVNITRSIKQMTELMPQDSLLASSQIIRRREEEKKKVDRLRKELAEIQQEEHELGLKLYRARKRQDKDADVDSTPLWVSRVNR